ncbi:MAG: tRNA (adenosine(37)-N6)-threonylcarbamoyltransferase complex dimerization subunit type 1 TsaB [Planctomycetota bacterium]
MPQLALAIETSSQGGSLAVVEHQTPIFTLALGKTQRTAAALGPALEKTLDWLRSRNEQPDIVGVSGGPGSFTGLRIAVSCAKTLAYALEVPLVAVDSLAAIGMTTQFDLQQSHSASDDSIQPSELWIGLNAYRGQVFGGRYQFTEPAAAISDVYFANAWQHLIADPAEDPIPVVGDAKVFAGHESRLVPRLSVDAVGVGLLALRLAAIGKTTDPMQLVPRYLRPSAAEEKAASS